MYNPWTQSSTHKVLPVECVSKQWTVNTLDGEFSEPTQPGNKEEALKL